MTDVVMIVLIRFMRFRMRSTAEPSEVVPTLVQPRFSVRLGSPIAVVMLGRDCYRFVNLIDQFLSKPRVPFVI
jgi:hypothetical protein